jgi:hypothetical protein
MNDLVVEEVRRVRQEQASRFNYDLDAICEDLRKQEELSGRTFVRLPPRKPHPSRKPRRTVAAGEAHQRQD